MSTYEASYKSLLQGVSQQLPQERLPGQVTSQINMMSDPVTNVRRRPGVEFKHTWEWTDSTDSSVAAWFTDIAGSRMHVLLDTNSGNIRMLNEQFVEEASLDASAYLYNSDLSKVRAVSMGNELFIANCAKLPKVTYVDTVPNPANSGFFYISAGAFSKNYNASLVYAGGSVTASYTTPSGTGAGDAALSTPEYIAQQLFAQLNGTTFTDVRVLSTQVEKDGSGGGSAPAYGSAVYQKNTGSPLAPTWVTQTLPIDVPASDVTGGLTALLYTDTTPYVPPPRGIGGLGVIRRNRFRFTFQVKVLDVWQATVYTTNWIDVPRYPVNASHTNYQYRRGLQTTVYTDVATVSGAPAYFIVRTGPYVFATQSGGLTINTDVGTGFMLASKTGAVSDAGNLPARLPTAADGYIVRVGLGKSPQYFRYEADTAEWIETGAYGSISGIVDAPISIIWNGTAWALNTDAFEGRLAGDDVSNEMHEWITNGITGMGTYQGRLAILSGPMVSLSASNKPRRFFRSTVTSILSSDSIEVGASMNSAAAYEWAIPFQKDLLLFSKAYQAVIPSGNAAITPSTATVVPTSGHEVDTLSSPVVMGRTLMYSSPKSKDFFGMLEMVPSNYTDSQYISQDSTPHLPKYMAGRCRFAVSSGVASMGIFGSTGDKNALIIHEYHWDGDTKVQQAWHQWSFKYPIATAYFASDVIVVVFVLDETAIIGVIDPRAGIVNAESEHIPFLDLNMTVPIVDNVITPPAWMLPFINDLVAVVPSGLSAGSVVGTTVVGATLVTVPSYANGAVKLGLPYYSGIIPSPPVVRDYNEGVIHTGKASILRFMIGTSNSSEFKVNIDDAYQDYEEYIVPTLTWDNPEFQLGHALSGEHVVSVVPCRTDLRSTGLEIYTEGTGELNVTSLEYVAKFNPKIKRK